MKLAITALLACALLAPPLMADENRALWNRSTYMQSAKIHYQQIARKTKDRKDYYYCINLLREATSRYGRDPEIWFFMGNLYAQIDAIDTMSIIFDSVEAICGDSAMPKEVLAKCRKEDYFKHMTATRQDFWEKRYHEGFGYLGQYDTVVAMISRAPSEDSAKTLDSLRQKAFDLSQKCFEQAITAKPSDPTTYKALGALFQRAEDQKQAIEMFKKAMQLTPGGEQDADLVVKISEAYVKIPDWPNAVNWYEQYLQLKPDDVIAMNNLSIAYFQLQEIDKWYESCERILAIEPDNVQILAFTGEYWRMKTQEVADQLAEIPDTSLSGNTQRTDLEKKREEYTGKAIAQFEKVRQRDITQTGALKNLGILYLLSMKNSMAAAAFEDFLKTDSSDADVLDYLGRAYISDQKYPQAVRPYELLTAQDPGNVDAWERLEELYRHTGSDKAEQARAKIDALKKP